MTKKLSIPKLYAGMLAANLFGLIVIWATKYFTLDKPYENVYIYSDFILVPVAMGIICAFFWRTLGFNTKAYMGWSILTATVAILLSYIFLHEGTICLLIVSPLVFAFIIAGTFVGKSLFRKNNGKVNISVALLFVTLFLIDLKTSKPYEEEVTDVVVIHASPAEVWKHVAQFEPITEKPEYFLFKMGLPSPVQSTVDGYYEGAHRKCIFSNGYVFDETMTTFKPNENLTFDITHQPRDPEIMGHIDILRGQFLLHDNGDGTTTLTGNSWYRLYVAPAWYYNLWAESITSNVHIRAMQHIKMLSETH